MVVVVGVVDVVMEEFDLALLLGGSPAVSNNVVGEGGPSAARDLVLLVATAVAVAAGSCDEILSLLISLGPLA